MTISEKVSHYFSNLSSTGTGAEPLILTLSLTAKVSYLRSLSGYSEALISEIRALKSRGWTDKGIAAIFKEKGLASPRNRVPYACIIWGIRKKKAIKDSRESDIRLEIKE